MENKQNYELKNLNILDSNNTVKVLTDFITNYDTVYVLNDFHTSFFMYVKGNIFNFEKDKILDKFKECNYSFSKLNNSLNGEYCIIILKYEDSKLRHVYISVDYSGVNSVYYFLKKNNVYNCHDKLYVLSNLLASSDISDDIGQDRVLIEGGEQREIKIEDNVIKAEMFMIYKADINLKAFLNPTVYGESGSVEEIKQKAREVVKNAIKRRCQGDKIMVLEEEVKEGLVDEVIRDIIREIGVEIVEYDKDGDIISMKGRKELEMKTIHLSNEKSSGVPLRGVGETNKRSGMMSIHMKNMREIDGINCPISSDGAERCQGSLQGRVNVGYPFLDKEVVEFYKSLHPKIKLNNNLIN